MSLQKHLLKFQIGPVQEFIAQSRNTRDLWSGSYLLSWLMAAGIRNLHEHAGVELIFPNPEARQPLLDEASWSKTDSRDLLTPNLPNVFVAELTTSDARRVAKEVAEAISDEWRKIAEAVWEWCGDFELRDEAKDRFDAQVERHLSITWRLTPATGSDSAAYANDFNRNLWEFDAVRQTRDFRAWNSGGWQTKDCEKDSLSGREEAIVGGKKWQENIPTKYKHIFRHPDHLGAANLIKRVWHVAYLAQKPGLKAAVDQFIIRSTLAIASRNKEEVDGPSMELDQSEKYLAAIAFDGDKIGAWISGEQLAANTNLREHHAAFSKNLSTFALGKAHAIFERGIEGSDENHNPVQVPLGFLIYAGGDDVLALVPAEKALECARLLREAFVEVTKGTPPDKNGNKPDASAGIAIAHFKSPLQDLIREAKLAEKRAKNTVGRPAFSITMMKRSGEIEYWGDKWERGGLVLHEAIAQAMADGRLSGRFPHRVCALLEPYLTTRTSTRQRDAANFKAREIIEREFAHALERHSQGSGASDLLESLTHYLTAMGDEPQTLLQAVIGLCKSVAFSHRSSSTSH